MEVEHIVQDSCSDDGTQDWLPHDPRVKAFIEKDGGMYDAVNRGYRRATGDILAYLNCDEQYLPGALAAVEKFFAAASGRWKSLLAGSIVTDGDGNYLCHRHWLVPNPQPHLVSFSGSDQLHFHPPQSHSASAAFSSTRNGATSAIFTGCWR